MALVFVYGTLKENFPNFHINTGVRIEGEFCTKESYSLYLEGERYVPWLVLNKGNGYHIQGELYRVSQQTMDDMDILESIGKPSGYHKMQVPIVCSYDAVGDSNKKDDLKSEVSAFVYVKLLQQLQGANIKLGPFKEYTLEHALLYRPRCV